jgi:hypothetical protein
MRSFHLAAPMPPRYRGRGLVATEGVVCLTTFSDNSPLTGWCRPNFSIVSPGTEAWAIARSRHENVTIPLGYMAVQIRRGTNAAIAATPHGTEFRGDDPSVLTGRGSVECLVVGRFQLIAAAALSAVRGSASECRSATIVGSGPVAIGAAFEMRRRGNRHVQMVSRRAAWLRTVMAGVDWLDIRSPKAATPTASVIDCTGTSRGLATATRLLAPGGIIGLLGSPRVNRGLNLYDVHRRGLKVIGLHELLSSDRSRQRLFTSIVKWLSNELKLSVVSQWLCSWPGDHASTLYELLRRRRAAGLFHLLRWPEA